MGVSGNHKGPNRPRPAHFPITPFLNPPPPVPTIPPQHNRDNHSLRLTRMEHDSARRGLGSPLQEAQEGSIYDAFARSNNPYSEQVSDRQAIAATSDTTPRQAVPPLLSPNPVISERDISRSSSIDNFTNAHSVYSPSSTMTDLTDLQETHARLNMATPSDGGYETSSTVGRGGRRNRSNVRAHMETAEVLEEHADEDKASARISISSKMKADKVLGLAAPTTGLVSAYICSGLGLVSQTLSTSQILTHRSPNHGHTPTLMPSRASSQLRILWALFGDPRFSPTPTPVIAPVIFSDTASIAKADQSSLKSSPLS